MESRPDNTVVTRLLVISDTHGQGYTIPENITDTPIDVVVHCGDFTLHSKLSEIRTTLQFLDNIDASLKLIIAGNHDFSLDTPVFKEKIAEAKRLADGVDDALVQAEYGECGEARELFDRAKKRGTHLLDEGTHRFTLDNGAELKVYASPYTPCPAGEEPTWGFQYRDGHTFDIKEGTDLVITHGPPLGIFDSVNNRRLGCADLFGSVVRAKPKLHCFGHVHGGWGAKMAAWRDKISEAPSHFSDIDHGKSTTIHTLSTLREGKETESFCRARYSDVDTGVKTLFVNAALQGDYGLDQLPWIVDTDLPCVPR
ncbi:uncharacterized protein DNG_04616 [Cephalotrichum gorgonifer]|uniref:Calcineurin-like phosphoesterase domain-containing protein n=1 Tax=Cephalotrichum gorgonifer TaxID=2041049 RepID=A0AAE8MYU5_9PEZI|nr:uncharacterized protein DNG_04616 [Cephalotrichum gorgonifer]